MSKTLAQKLLDIQKTIAAVSKSSDNPYFKSKYADLNEVLSIVKGPLNAAGIVIVNSSGADSFGRYLETSLLNVEDNQQLSSRKYFSGNEENMQQLGAADSYSRRFNLTNLLSLESEDDDGESAVGRGGKTAVQKTATAAPKDARPPAAIQAKPRAAPSLGSMQVILEKISLTSKVIVDSRRDSQENVLALLTKFNVRSKEELSESQARELLSQLEEKLK